MSQSFPDDLADAHAKIRQLEAQNKQLQQQLEAHTRYLHNELRSELHYKKLIGNSAGLKQVRRDIERVAGTDSTTLITGETGTGKELIARAIHEQSPRNAHLLVKVNCAALPAGLITSELFGHEPGAFTGAGKKRIGRLELAHKGTLFLDEVAEIPADVQVLLLRTLQERTIERVGSNETREIDVRIIAATNKDLLDEVKAGRFRADLYYRLNVFPISVPPLRERADDIPLLLHHFRVQFNRRMNKQVLHIHTASEARAKTYLWPGNIRELENLVERGMIIATGDTLILDSSWFGDPTVPMSDNALTLAGIERQAIVQTLNRCAGKIYGPDGAAALLGLKPTTLYGKMRKLNIRKQSDAVSYE